MPPLLVTLSILYFQHKYGEYKYKYMSMSMNTQVWVWVWVCEYEYIEYEYYEVVWWDWYGTNTKYDINYAPSI